MAAPRSQPDKQWRTMTVATAVAGLAGVVLLFAGQGMVGVGGGEPSFDAPAAEILSFVEARDDVWYPIGSYLGVLAIVASLWFVVGLWPVLRYAEGEPAWRSLVALASGIVWVASLMNPGWDLGVFRRDEELDPQLARLAFDMGNLGFAVSWIAMASFLVSAGWVFVSSARLPAWLGWWAIVAGVGFLAGSAVWTTALWLAPYALFWIWVIIVCVQLLRRKFNPVPA
jgi:hypothetical protein